MDEHTNLDTRLLDAINRVRAELKRLDEENTVMREALEWIAYMGNGVLSTGLYCSEIAKDALKTIEG